MVSVRVNIVEAAVNAVRERLNELKFVAREGKTSETPLVLGLAADGKDGLLLRSVMLNPFQMQRSVCFGRFLRLTIA